MIDSVSAQSYAVLDLKSCGAYLKILEYVAHVA